MIGGGLGLRVRRVDSKGHFVFLWPLAEVTVESWPEIISTPECSLLSSSCRHVGASLAHVAECSEHLGKLPYPGYPVAVKSFPVLEKGSSLRPCGSCGTNQHKAGCA